MNWLQILLLALAAIAGGYFLLVLSVVTYFTRRLKDVRQWLVPVDEGPELPDDVVVWTADHNWQFEGWCRSAGMVELYAGLFREPGGPRFLCVTIAGGSQGADPQIIVYEFLTATNNGGGLSSQNARSTTLAAPHYFVQSFTGLSIDQLWQRHLGAERYLGQAYRLSPRSPNRSTVEFLYRHYEQHYQDTASRFGWPVQIAWYHVVTSRRRHNRTVESLDQRWPRSMSEVWPAPLP